MTDSKIIAINADTSSASKPKDVQHYMRPGTLQLTSLPPETL